MLIRSHLIKHLQITSQDIDQLAASAPNMYKIYTIPKRNMGKRVIAHPSKKLKSYQRALIEFLDMSLPIHEAAFAYRKGIGIKENAMVHTKQRYLLKMDLQNYFHSITPELFFKFLDTLDINFDEDDRYLLQQIVFWRPSKKRSGKLILSIGAPSSPLISNSILYFFDKELSSRCKLLHIKYSRYADDLTFSTNKKDILFSVPTQVKELLKKTFQGSILVNDVKTVFSSKAHNRHVTGITLNNEGRISIGRERKRYLYSLVHKYKLGQLTNEDIKHTQGLLAFAKNIEPSIESRLIRKYSFETIKKLKSEHL